MPPIGRDAPCKIVLDTSAYSWMRSGHEGALDEIASAELVWVPTVVIGELEAGFALGGRPRENAVVLEEFLAEPYVSVLPVTRDVARRYGGVFAALKRAGTPIPVNDVWIGAAVLDCGGCLVTFDEHFASIPGLDLRLLEPG